MDMIYKMLKRILSFYSYEVNKKINQKINFVYSTWLSNSFHNVGSGTRFLRPTYLHGGKRIRIGNDCLFARYCEISAWEKYQGFKYTPQLIIGNNCNFGPYCHITCCNKVYIGNGLLTGMNVIISDNNHGTFSQSDLMMDPSKRNLTTKGEVVIGKNVWLGDKVAVLSGVHIGDGAIVAANAVVTKDIPPYSLAAGVPAKVIKMLNKE